MLSSDQMPEIITPAVCVWGASAGDSDAHEQTPAKNQCIKHHLCCVRSLKSVFLMCVFVCLGWWSIRWTCRTSTWRPSGRWESCGRSKPSTESPVSPESNRDSSVLNHTEEPLIRWWNRSNPPEKTLADEDLTLETNREKMTWNTLPLWGLELP